MNGLPEAFSIREAFKFLDWQGSRKGLARHLEANGYAGVERYDPRSRAMRVMWSVPAPPPVPMSECHCRCHTNTCGANDMDLAERSIQLVERLCLNDADTITVLHDLVHRAGVDHAQAALKRVALDDDVPF